MPKCENLGFLIFLKMKIWKTLESDPLFHHSESRLTLDEERHLIVMKMNRLKEYNFLPFDELIADMRKVCNIISNL